MMESLIWNTGENAIRGSTGSIRKRLRWQSKPLQNIVNMETQTCYQGAIQRGMDPGMDYSSNQLLNQQKKPELEHKRKSHKRRHTVHRAYKKSAEVAKQTFAKHCNGNPNLLYQGAIHGGGMDHGMDYDYSTNQLLNVVVANQLYSCQPVVQLPGGVVSQQSKNPTNQLGNQLLNGIFANQQKKPVMNVQQLLVTQKPQVCETWSGFSNFYFC